MVSGRIGLRLGIRADALRPTPKPALAAVRHAYLEAPLQPDETWPRISVVVCSYNGNRTIGETLTELAELSYPNFETIVIDDGSTDGVRKPRPGST